jgi:hypothetical protein
MISRRSLPRTAVVFAALSASLIYATGCSSGGLEPSPSVEAAAHVEQAVDSFCTGNPNLPTVGSNRSPTAWKWLVQSTPFMDVNTDLACAVSLANPGAVMCYLPDVASSPPQARITNWGAGCTSSSGTTQTCTGVPVASSAPRGVAILKHREVARRNGGGNYGVYVLLADSRVMVTRGDTDHWFEGQNFKTYSLFMSPVSSTGQSLSFKKIVWINEDGMTDWTVIPRLLALTNDNQLYYTDLTGTAWKFYMDGVRDMSHLPGRGDTIVFTGGQVHYGAFNPSSEYRGYLPNPPGETIVAVGGFYALTNDGCGGNCADNISTFCAGDDTRILRFDWPKYKWEPVVNRLAESNPGLASSFYPIGAGYACSGCGPQVTTSIVDPHGFGGNNLNTSSSFNTGPFVYAAVGSRTHYYNPQPTALPSPVFQCKNGDCGGYCGHLSDGSPCPADGVGPRVCDNQQCVACGGTNQFPCPGLDCSKLPGGAAAGFMHRNRCVLRSQAFPGWVQPSPGTGPYSAPAANGRNSTSPVIDLYATRLDTGDLHYRVGRFSTTTRVWDWGTWASLGKPATGIMGKPSSTGWSFGVVSQQGGAVAVRTQVGGLRQIAVKFVNYATGYQGWTQIPGGDLEQDPTIVFRAPHLYVFAPGSNHQFWFSKNDITNGYNAANWTGWQNIPGGVLTSAGSAAVDNWGTIYLASRGSDNMFYVIKSTDGGVSWGNWNYVSSPTTFLYSPLLVWNDWGKLKILGTATTADGNQRVMLSSSPNGESNSWSPFESTDPYPASAPAGVTTNVFGDWTGHIELFVLGTDNQVWKNYYID